MLSKILGRRELMAYAVIGTVCAGFFLQLMTAEQFAPIATAVVAFYFGQRGGEKAEQ